MSPIYYREFENIINNQKLKINNQVLSDFEIENKVKCGVRVNKNLQQFIKKKQKLAK